MSMPKPAGAYVEPMIDQGGWPEVDEDTLYDRARAFTQVLQHVTEVLESAEHQRAEIFDGGIWAGDAAEAANVSLDRNVEQLTRLQNAVTTAINWHSYAAAAIVEAKTNIGHNVEAAHRQIHSVQNDPKLSAVERGAAISAAVSVARSANVSVVADTAEQILATQDWAASANPSNIRLDRNPPPPVVAPSSNEPPPTRQPGEPRGPRPGWPLTQDASMSNAPSATSSLAAQASVVRPASESGPSAAGDAAQEPVGQVTAAPRTIKDQWADRHAAASPAAQGPGGVSVNTSSPVVARNSETDAPIVPAPAIPAPGSGGTAASVASASSGRPPTQAVLTKTPPTPTRPAPALRREPARPADCAAPPLIPISATRAARDAAIEAGTVDAVRRRNNGTDPLLVARRIAGALNATDHGAEYYGFLWLTAVTAAGAILVANSYGLAYIPGSVKLPQQVIMTSADTRIPAGERASWATHPLSALQRWAIHHITDLRAVIGTAEQLANSDPGVAKVILEPDDIPATGRLGGRSRLEVVDPAAAARLAETADPQLIGLLPPALAGQGPPAELRPRLWLEVQKPMTSNAVGRERAHLRAFHAFATHARDVALSEGHTARDAGTQRSAIADWLYWKHVSDLLDTTHSARS